MAGRVRTHVVECGVYITWPMSPTAAAKLVEELSVEPSPCGYEHVARPATPAEIARDQGVSKTEEAE